MLVCTGHKLRGRSIGERTRPLAKKGVGNTRKSGFYIERGRDGVRMG